MQPLHPVLHLTISLEVQVEQVEQVNAGAPPLTRPPSRETPHKEVIRCYRDSQEIRDEISRQE
ncbi:hypothetical protein KIN20_028292 [Parelaphostrongylus tenuis]|uniref:Uncharacterized protein n=1 Tax=Parelaphostrongylus tenuis TaxID=148309 RepID=A0AAD5R0K3_PARTN|nr:hypothetical protein KIN20_028292 [Parelaphostrongylus tenuis]